MKDGLSRLGMSLASPSRLYGVTTVLSNLVSNVPAVMLLLPLVRDIPGAGYILAVSSTFAGTCSSWGASPTSLSPGRRSGWGSPSTGRGTPGGRARHSRQPRDGRPVWFLSRRVFFIAPQEKEITFLGQTSTQAPQEMHSGENISSRRTMAFTSRLMGQFFVQSLQSMHLSLSARDGGAVSPRRGRRSARPS